MQELYMETGEEVIYCLYLIKDIILHKFIAFIFEE